MTRTRRSPAHPDDGFTLVELLVTIMLSMLIMALVTGLVTASRGVLVTERARTDDLGVAFPAMDQMQRTLRSAVPSGVVVPGETDSAVTTAGATSVSFYSLAYTARSPVAGDKGSAAERTAAQPRLITLSLDPDTDTLRMTTVQPRLVGGVWQWTGTSTTRAIARGVANDSATPLFRYRDDGGTALTGPLASSTQRAQIAFVEIDMVVDTNNGQGRPVEVTDTVRLANYGMGKSA